MKLEITVTLPANTDNDLFDFYTVEGTWEVSDSDYQHLVPAVAAQEASVATGGRLTNIPAEDLKVELFRADGRSLDGSDGITSGNFLITRRA
jgi:hypothetical protein